MYVTASFCCSFKPVILLMMPDNNTTHLGPAPRPDWYSKIRVPLIVVLIIGVMILEVFRFFNNLGVGNIFAVAYNFVAAPVAKLDSANGRTNILVMGKAGGVHEGPDLTDTMILISVGITKPSIDIISIPRDIWIPEIRAKINSAYYWGKNGSPYLDVSEMGGGISFSKIIAGEVVGKPIQYGVVIDFTAFKDIIDTLGGIEVDVANSFTDKLYPIVGKENDACGGDPTFACRYETVSFIAGPQIMKGDTALIFVRSRHAEGVEGTDQAREARQQKVIDAIKNKITQPSVFLNPNVDLAMVNIFKKYVETDINGPTAAILARVALNGSGSINQSLIPSNLLINPPISKVYDNQYVLIPNLGNGMWSDINKWFSGVLQ